MLFVLKGGCLLIGYMTVKEASTKWGLSTRWINKLCQDMKIPGAELFGGVYAIPVDAKKPTEDRRIKTGAYKNWRKKYGRNKIPGFESETREVSQKKKVGRPPKIVNKEA